MLIIIFSCKIDNVMKNLKCFGCINLSIKVKTVKIMQLMSKYRAKTYLTVFIKLIEHVGVKGYAALYCLVC